MQDLTIHAKLYVCCKTEGWRWSLLLEVYIIYIKCLVTEMAADHPLTGRTISNGCLYTSIESTNWLLDCGNATVGTLQKGKSGIPSGLFGTQNRATFSATCNFEKEKENICLKFYTDEKSQKKRKILLCFGLKTITC